MDLRAHVTARLLANRPLPLLGRLLTDTTRAGAPVAIDPDSGNELREGDDPAFVLSTESEALDLHIVRQHWDLGRGVQNNGPGVPVLWNHNADVFLGQWRELGVREVPDLVKGPSLIGRPAFSAEEMPQMRRRQVRAGELPGVSVGWMRGEAIRRGDLPEDDPDYREPEDDWCDQPAEGMVMGTAEAPNILIEASITPIPAQAQAKSIRQLNQRAAAELRELGLSGIEARQLDHLLARLGGDARVITWARGLLRAALVEEEFRALLRTALTEPANQPVSPTDPLLADLLGAS